MDPTIPVLALQSVRQGLMQSMETPRFTTMLLMAFAALALLLATVGVYGVIAYPSISALRRSASGWHWVPRRRTFCVRS